RFHKQVSAYHCYALIYEMNDRLKKNLLSSAAQKLWPAPYFVLHLTYSEYADNFFAIVRRYENQPQSQHKVKLSSLMCLPPNERANRFCCRESFDLCLCRLAYRALSE